MKLGDATVLGGKMVKREQNDTWSSEAVLYISIVTFVGKERC